MNTIIQFILQKSVDVGSSVAKDTVGAIPLFILHFVIFLTVSFAMDRLKLNLPKDKISSIKNRVYCMVYSLIIVISLFREFIINGGDHLSAFRVVLFRFIIAYHPFHLIELKYYGLINKCFVYHHIGATFLAYAGPYFGRSYLLGVCYLLAEYNHLLFQVRFILRDAYGKSLPRAFDAVNMIYILNFIACRGIAWPLLVIRAGIHGYPMMMCGVCMGFWIYFLSTIFGGMRPVLKRSISNVFWKNSKMIAQMQ